MSTVTMGGNPVNVAGNFPQKGQAAPDFKLVGKDLKDVVNGSRHLPISGGDDRDDDRG